METGFTTPPCPVCHKSSVVLLDRAKLDLWKGGSKIQDVWPEWTPDERELLMTGSHPGCWKEMFPPWIEVEGVVVGFYSKTEDDILDVAVVKVKRYKTEDSPCWSDEGDHFPPFVLRGTFHDHEVIGRGTGWTEESSPGLGDTIRFSTNKIEQDDYSLFE